MAHSFKFCVLQAAPNRQRGERVNVGIVVFLTDRLDIRLPESRKMTALTGQSWDEITRIYAEQITKAFKDNRDVERLLKSYDFMSEIFLASDLGTLTVNSLDDYETRVKSILDALVNRPKSPRSERQVKINAEISKTLRRSEILAKQGETIDDHKVVPRFVVSEEKDVTADFAYKNGKLKVVSTLDLRGIKSAHTKACEKGATLYFAKEKFGRKVKPFGVYAVSPLEVDAYRSEIEILRSFADGNTFNWLERDARGKFLHELYYGGSDTKVSASR